LTPTNARRAPDSPHDSADLHGVYRDLLTAALVGVGPDVTLQTLISDDVLKVS